MKKKTNRARPGRSSGSTSQLEAWQKRAERRVRVILASAAQFPTLVKMGISKQSAIEVRLVGAPQMRRLNSQYRDKDYPTDVLSFSSPEVFYRSGILGELVVCYPVLKAQAQAFKHSVAKELDILLTHGVLHLVGFDHEKGRKEANLMSRWEARILELLAGSGAGGLIARANSGNK